MPSTFNVYLAAVAVLATPATSSADLTYQVKDINPGPYGDGLDYYATMADLDGRLVFFAHAQSYPAPPQPWISDGTDTGTTQISPIGSSTAGGIAARYPMVSNGHLFFWYDDGSTAEELWSTDGTAAGTHRLTDMRPKYYAGPSPRPDGVFFIARASAVDDTEKLWISDGTGLGTMQVDPNATVYSAWGVTVADETAFYGADVSGSPGLMRSDGSILNTVDLQTSPFGLSLAVNERIYGAEQGSQTDYGELRSAITSDSSTLQLLPSSSGSQLSEFIRVDDKVLFDYDDGSDGSELWVSDGTPEGTFLVRDIDPGNPGSNPVPMAAINGTLYFMADDGTHGRELWRSDGTADGTSLVKDIQPGLAHGLPPSVDAVVANQKLYFAAYDDTSKLRLWISDGSTGGTHLVDSPGPELSAYGLMAVSNGRLFFQADSGSGLELHALNLVTAPSPMICKNPEQPLRDNGAVRSILQLPVGSGFDVGNLSVSLDIGHTYVGDLAITLTHTETGHTATLLSADSSCGGQLLDLRLDDQAPYSVNSECLWQRPAWPRDTSYRPATALSIFQGEDVAGQWVLTIIDSEARDSGTLHEWCLHFNDRVFANSFE